MANKQPRVAGDSSGDRAPWTPMVVIGMGQALMSFNVAALPVSMSGIVESFDAPPTTVGTAIVLYSLGVSGFIMLGAKLGQRFGAKTFFQAAVAMFLVALITMVLSPTAEVMLAAQALAGLSGAALVPNLVVLIAQHYEGRQQAEAVGWLGSARAIAGVLAFIIVGFVAMVNWRLAFGLLALHATAILILSTKLKPAVRNPAVKIDVVGVVLSAAALMMVIFGFNNIRNWGLLAATPSAPFELWGVSPAPMMIFAGLVIGVTFLAWTQWRAQLGATPLVALEVVSSPQEWAALFALFVIVAMEGAINFSVPLYIQIVQGGSSLMTSVAMMPFMLTVFFTAILIVRLYSVLSPRAIARGAFFLVAVGTAWLAFVVRNDWGAPTVVAGLITVGLGQGALVTLLFNVLVTAAPRELAADVGSIRGVTQNLAAAVGTAVVGALLVGVLTSSIVTASADNPVISAELKDQVNLTNLNFLSDAQLDERLANIQATTAERREAIAINAEARTRALKIGFAILSALALLAIAVCNWLPDYRAGDTRPPRAVKKKR
jgi:MFS family permease